MTKQQVVSDLQTNVQDVIDNLRAVKGDPYADTVAIAHMGLHFARLMKQVSVMHDVPKEVENILFAQHAQLLEASLKCIHDAYNMSNQTLDEILDWASKLDDKVDQAMELLAKEN